MVNLRLAIGAGQRAGTITCVTMGIAKGSGSNGVCEIERDFAADVFYAPGADVLLHGVSE